MAKRRLDPSRPLSFVGASNGARRRAALRMASDAYHANGGAVAKCEYVAEARASYRIGERLRPCPWKHDERGCMGKGQEGSGPGDAYCDGSGVLPARKSRGDR